MVYNQREIDSFDQKLWRSERTVLNNRLSIFCQNNKISFFPRITLQEIEVCKYDTIITTWLFDLMPNLTFWQDADQLCKKFGKRIFVITDNLVDLNNLECVEFHAYVELMGMTASYDANDFVESVPSRLYNCFIQRADSIRQSWFYFLYHLELLDKGYVSLLMKHLTGQSNLTGKALFDHIHYSYKLDRLPHFERAFQATRNLIPFRNFTESENLLPLILDSKYSLVLETYSTEDDQGIYCFTEKTLRTIQFPSIPLLFVQKNGISRLKNLGFVIGDHLDELDNQHWIQRQQMLLEILKNESIDYNWKKLYNNCKINQTLLQTYKNKYQKDNFFDKLFDRTKK
jgi:hypothetical protein